MGGYVGEMLVGRVYQGRGHDNVWGWLRSPGLGVTCESERNEKKKYTGCGAMAPFLRDLRCFTIPKAKRITLCQSQTILRESSRLPRSNAQQESLWRNLKRARAGCSLLCNTLRDHFRHLPCLSRTARRHASRRTGLDNVRINTSTEKDGIRG